MDEKKGLNERLGYIDAIKGVAIFLMVMGHVLAWCFADFNDVKDNGPYSATFWWRVIYAFHMPLFFCVSGFLYCKEKLTWGGVNFFYGKDFVL